MSAFSDDDLERLKEYPVQHDWPVLKGKKLMSLIARLEAAERLIGAFIYSDQSHLVKKLLMDWVKAAGK